MCEAARVVNQIYNSWFLLTELILVGLYQGGILTRAFIVPYFRYCSVVWNFCAARNRDKWENLNKREGAQDCSR